MLENAQSFIVEIVSSSDWLPLATFILSMIAVLLVSLVKLIISVALKNKGVSFDKKKFEFLFAFASFALAFGINFLFIWGHSDNSLVDIAKQASGYALDTSSIYLLIFNVGKKGIKYVWNKIKTKLADGKLSKQEMVEVINEMSDDAKEMNVVDAFLKSIENK